MELAEYISILNDRENHWNYVVEENIKDKG